jgi:hypothetical protein
MPSSTHRQFSILRSGRSPDRLGHFLETDPVPVSRMVCTAIAVLSRHARPPCRSPLVLHTRHSKEWWQHDRGRVSGDAETAFWRPYRTRLLQIVILIFVVFCLRARFGYLESIERSPIEWLYRPIGIAVAAMILILLWSSRNPFLVLLRGVVLLLMTAILSAGTVGLFYALFENQITPTVALPLAAIVCVNFVFHHRWEKSNLV